MTLDFDSVLQEIQRRLNGQPPRLNLRITLYGWNAQVDLDGEFRVNPELLIREGAFLADASELAPNSNYTIPIHHQGKIALEKKRNTPKRKKPTRRTHAKKA